MKQSEMVRLILDDLYPETNRGSLENTSIVEDTIIEILDTAIKHGMLPPNHNWESEDVNS